MTQYRKGVEETGIKLVGGLAPGADRTGVDKCTGVRFQHGPPEAPPYQGDGALHPSVTGQMKGVCPPQDLGADRVRDKQMGIRITTGVWLGYLGIPHHFLNLPGNRSHNTGGRDDSVGNSRTSLS